MTSVITPNGVVAETVLSDGSAPLGRRRRRFPTGRALTYTVLSLGLLAWLMPFIWMALGSIKTQAEILARPPTFLPQQPTLEHFARWFNELGFWRYFTNSLVVALFTVLGNLIFCSMVGYALAKMEFRGKRILFVAVMTMLMVPGVVTFVPLFVMVARLGLLNTYPALILPFVTSPLGVFLMRQFMQGIPNELMEAARVDGAGEFRIFWQVVLPLCGPPLATLGILTFLGSWNNFLWPLVAGQNREMFTLPVALSLYSVGAHGVNHGLMLAGAVLVITPILLLFVFLQRYFIQGIATVGLK